MSKHESRDLLTAAQMRALEAETMASGAVSGLELMERAGRGVVEAMFAEWPELARVPHRAVVLCGPGNNGGDGFVIARLLKGWGWPVEVFLYGTHEKLPPDARRNFERWAGMGAVHMRAIGPPPLADDTLPLRDFDVLIDALFGTGLTRPFTGLFTMLGDSLVQERLQAADVKRVAVDIPTGLCADSGRVLGDVLPADLTVTFHSRKPGHLLDVGPEACGALRVVDIGLPQRALGQMPPAAVAQRLPDPAMPARLNKAAGHKYDHGHALILSGPMGRSGAARLAARAALRVGAGLVTVAAPGSAMLECAAQLTAIMLRKCDGAAGLVQMLEDARLNALCLGPGLGVGEGTRDLVATAAVSGRPLVLDADALTSFADDPDTLFAQLPPAAVLTPHAGEFARLFPDLAERLTAQARTGPCYSKIDATRAAAARAGCVVLHKGADTVIADPEGRAVVNATVGEQAAPWLATAGAGDVLAGVITGLMARGWPAFEAAGSAAWLHAEAARRFGPGLIAEDLPETLPQVLAALDAPAGALAGHGSAEANSNPSA